MESEENFYQSSEVVDLSGQEQRNKNSKIGITSFVLSLISSLGGVAIFGYSAYMGASGRWNFEVKPVEAVWLGFGVLLCLATLSLGLVLGVVGLFQKGFRRTFAIIGVSLSMIIIILVSGTIWIGMNLE